LKSGSVGFAPMVLVFVGPLIDDLLIVHHVTLLSHATNGRSLVKVGARQVVALILLQPWTECRSTILTCVNGTRTEYAQHASLHRRIHISLAVVGCGGLLQLLLLLHAVGSLVVALGVRIVANRSDAIWRLTRRTAKPRRRRRRQWLRSTVTVAVRRLNLIISQLLLYWRLVHLIAVAACGLTVGRSLRDLNEFDAIRQINHDCERRRTIT
jgi:hypothetical protein